MDAWTPYIESLARVATEAIVGGLETALAMGTVALLSYYGYQMLCQ